MYRAVRNIWLSITLKQKLALFTVMVVLIMAVSAVFNVQVVEYALGGFNEILEDNSRCHDLQEAVGLETEAFETYVRDRSGENREAYVLSCVRTERCIASLPFDYSRIGEERYARTWNVKNGYQNYSELRDRVMELDIRDPSYISRLYRVYDLQAYIQTYVRRLVQVTLKDGNASYQMRVPQFRNIPYMIMVFSVVLTAAAMWLTRLMGSTVVRPVVRLAAASRDIARNEFKEEDITVENRDEMGELVQAFNKMKHATRDYIQTLEKNSEMATLLHQEEIERVEMERQLNSARLDLLKSQINPHFLFNTLNMIGCMANLEEAPTTEKMISSMSNLFRYNLKTSEQFVPLERELNVVRDYVYIQQMRFGERIRYDFDIRVDTEKVIIPSFTLQPIVENAVLHGLSKKEQGGRLFLRIWQQENRVWISVADTGLGMEEDECRRLQAALKSRKTARVGIGLGNIYKRIHLLYEKGDLRIYSRKNHGTVIQMIIPQNQAEGEERA